MRIKLPLPRAWPVVSEEPRLAEVLPNVMLTMGKLVPLPRDLKAWGEQTVFGGLPREEVRVALVQDMTTEKGWKVSLFGSDVIHPRSKAVLERRLHAFYHFHHHAGIASLASANTVLFDAAVKDVTAVLLRAEPDWSGDEIVCVHELWEGLPLEKPVEEKRPTSSAIFAAMAE